MLHTVSSSFRRGAGMGAGLGLAAALALGATSAQSADVFLGSAAGGTVAASADQLVSLAESRGSVRVIVKLNTDFEPEGNLSAFGAANQRVAISSLQGRVASRVLGERNVHNYETVPMMAMTVDAAAAQALLSEPSVKAIYEDIPVPVALNKSIPIVRANKVWKKGNKTGKGWTVAVLDTGYDNKHDAFKGKVKAEACFSSNVNNGDYVSTSACKNQKRSHTGKNAGKYCDLSVSGCDHGTHVAGIAVGNPGGNKKKYRGVAYKANLMPVQVFSLFTTCNGSPCNVESSWVSDQVKALEWVYGKRKKYKIASINMSLGGNAPHSSNCDLTDSRTDIISQLRSKKIATVIASGNNGWNGYVSAPACISYAVTVGATNDSDTGISSFSNHANMVDVLAPGGSHSPGIYAPVPKKSYGYKSGTSMAAPHIAGAYALLKQTCKSASVKDIEKALEKNGPKFERDGIKKRRSDFFGAYKQVKKGC